MDSLRAVSGLPHYTATTTIEMKSSQQSRSNRAPSRKAAPRAPNAQVAAPPPRRNPTPRNRGLDSGLVDQACGLVDAFCPHARGAKYPDDSSQRTLPFTFQFTQTLSSDSNGRVGAYLLPRIGSDGSGLVALAPVTVATLTAPTNFGATTVATLTGASRYRIVSAGFKLRRISPSLTTSGMVFVRSLFETDTMASNSPIEGDTYSASKTVDVPLVDAHELCFLHEHSSQMPQDFYPFGINTFGIATLNGFCPATILVTGAPVSTPILQLEYVMHVEYMFDPTAALALAATPAPVANSLLTTAVNRLTSAGSNFFHENAALAGKAIRNHAVSILTSFLRGGGAGPQVKLLTAGYDMIRNVD